MGRASSRKQRERHLTDAEKQRREQQASKSRKPTADEARFRDRAGVVVLDDPSLSISMRYTLSVPGNPFFRSSAPVTVSGKIAANDEGDFLRDLLLTVIEHFGFQRNVRAVGGVLAHAANAYPNEIRQELFRGIATGQGLRIFPVEATVCTACGAEREVQSILDPHAPEGAQLEEEDTTVHAPGCPTQPQVDAEAMAEAPEGAEPVMRAGTEPVWETRNGVYIDTPQLYRPLFTPQEQSQQEIPEEQLDEPLDLPEGIVALPVPEEAAVCDD